MRVDEAPEIARWFLRGLSVSDKPLFDGMCAMCATLLHGVIGDTSAQSNKTTGAPMNRDGVVLVGPDGEPQTDAPPPALLRCSPAFFAKEAPEVFEYDEDTNCLSLKEGAR